jgi:hypothetical protein
MKTLCLILLLIAGPAWAVPTVPVTSGYISVRVHDDFAPVVHLETAIATLDALNFYSMSDWRPLAGYGPGGFGLIPRGETVTFSAEGRFYLTFPPIDSPTISDWHIETGSIVADVDETGFGVLTAPFTLQGSVLEQFGPTLWHYAGAGTVSVLLGDTGAGLRTDTLQWWEIGYIIEPVIATPEPGTWLLLAGGLGVLLFVRKKVTP